jgi:hypothetical protein
VGSLATIAAVVGAVLGVKHMPKSEKPLKTIMPAKSIFSKKVVEETEDDGYWDDDDD